MQPETAKRLPDASTAAQELQHFIEGKTAASINTDRGLQLIVHKLLEIIGEALNGVRRSEPAIAARIPNLQRYVSLRNRITHGYDNVDYEVLLIVAQLRVPGLIDVLDDLLREAPPPGQA